MAHFIPSAGVHTKGSCNSTATCFLRTVKEEASMGSGEVGRQTPWQRFSGCAGDCGARVLRALAVTTATRSDALPDIPTLAEFVPGYEASQWYGVGAPKDTPAEVTSSTTRSTPLRLIPS
jgi:tripartite tricarboxylate transporter family receptor